MSKMRMLQSLQLIEQFSEKVTEARKSSWVRTIIVLCFISIPVIFMMKNSNLLFDSPKKTNSASGENSLNFRNTTTKISGASMALNASPVIPVKPGNLSNPPTPSEMPIRHQNPSDKLNLLPKFDEESCLSRYQSPSYRKNRPYNPSPYLKSRLRSYEQLHSRCGPQSLLYAHTIRKLMKTSYVNHKTTVPCKYLVWTPANGLGNRMVSIVSAFLYAILQNRVLLVEFEAEMNGLFCEPFPNTSWLLPHKFPHKNRWSHLPTLNNSRENMGDKRFSPTFLHLVLQHGSGDLNLHKFHCNDTQSLLEKVPVVVLLSDQYFVPSLFMMRSLREELNKLFPQKGAVFHFLGQYLFNPSNEAWGLITRFYQAYLSKADETIGIQLRIFNPKKAQHQKIITQILSCVQSYNILPSLSTNQSANFPPQNQTSRSKSVLVASLYPEYAEELRTMYWTKPTVTGEVIGVYQPSHEEFQKFGDNMHNMKAWAEIYLLSLCDVLVTSPMSTFDYVAQSLGGLKPWIMSRLGSNMVPNPPCKQDFSPEPCFHTPPKLNCQSSIKIDNITALSPHLRSCEDLWWGVKLG